MCTVHMVFVEGGGRVKTLYKSRLRRGEGSEVGGRSREEPQGSRTGSTTIFVTGDKKDKNVQRITDTGLWNTHEGSSLLAIVGVHNNPHPSYPQDTPVLEEGDITPTCVCAFESRHMMEVRLVRSGTKY